MTKKLPQFKSEEEIREFWASHDSTEYFDELEELSEPIIMTQPRQPITVRLDTRAVERLQELAAKQGIGYQTLIQRWVMNRLEEEYPSSG
ncbi:MAG TPA: hypothetical protein EYP55_11710 [Anaerolineae bacterium]|nr:hypothetical protein [Anaerolineae bacterium]